MARPQRHFESPSAIDPTTGAEFDLSSLPQPGQAVGVLDVAGTMVREEVTPQEVVETPHSGTGKPVWYFCLNRHGNGAGLHPWSQDKWRRNPFGDPGRCFQWPDDGSCPECPKCLDEDGHPVQVNAVRIHGEGVVPDLRPAVRRTV